jgi:hypothetical protein
MKKINFLRLIAVFLMGQLVFVTAFGEISARGAIVFPSYLIGNNEFQLAEEVDQPFLDHALEGLKLKRLQQIVEQLILLCGRIISAEGAAQQGAEDIMVWQQFHEEVAGLLSLNLDSIRSSDAFIVQELIELIEEMERWAQFYLDDSELDELARYLNELSSMAQVSYQAGA